MIKDIIHVIKNKQNDKRPINSIHIIDRNVYFEIEKFVSLNVKYKRPRNKNVKHAFAIKYNETPHPNI